MKGGTENDSKCSVLCNEIQNPKTQPIGSDHIKNVNQALLRHRNNQQVEGLVNEDNSAEPSQWFVLVYGPTNQFNLISIDKHF